MTLKSILQLFLFAYIFQFYAAPFHLTYENIYWCIQFCFLLSGCIICQQHSSRANLSSCLWGVCAARCHYPAPRVEVIPLSAQIPSLWTNDEINPAQSSSLLPSTVCLCPSETECATSIRAAGLCRLYKLVCLWSEYMQCGCFLIYSLCFTSFLMAIYCVSQPTFLFPCVFTIHQ